MFLHLKRNIMKTLTLIILSITAGNMDSTTCTAVNVDTKDTGTLVVFNTCVLEGDTIKINK